MAGFLVFLFARVAIISRFFLAVSFFLGRFAGTFLRSFFALYMYWFSVSRLGDFLEDLQVRLAVRLAHNV